MTSSSKGGWTFLTEPWLLEKAYHALRIFQHTPGTYPRPRTNSLCLGIPFNLGVWGGLGYAPGVCWGSLRHSHDKFPYFTNQSMQHRNALKGSTSYTELGGKNYHVTVQENYNTPPEHTPGNPPSQLWKESLYSLLAKVKGCVPKVCWNNLRNRDHTKPLKFDEWTPGCFCWKDLPFPNHRSDKYGLSLRHDILSSFPNHHLV